MKSTVVGLGLAVVMALGMELHGEVGKPWRSALYPGNWTPVFSDDQGRFLHDFSYAGYHRGEKKLPDVAGAAIDVTKAPYLADPTGTKDSTAAIQAALDAAAKAGGGVVLMPAGTYRVAPPTPGSKVALQVGGSKTVLRGAGAGKTFLFNDSTDMRNKRVIEVQAGEISDATVAGNLWYKDNPASSSPLVADVPIPSTRLAVKDASAFAAGDLVAVRSDVTQRFIDQLGMAGKWPTKEEAEKGSGSVRYAVRGMLYCRRIVAVDAGRNEIVLDVPTRYPLLTADNARVVKLTDPMISEVGLEDFSIGMRAHPKPGWETIIPRLCPVPVKGDNMVHEDSPDWAEGAYDVAGTPAHDVHQSYAIAFVRAENCWMRRVNSYSPAGNPPGVHILSNTVLLDQSRFITVDACDFKFPQYQGGGGNGYHFVLHSEDCLLRDCVAEGGRHNYDFGGMHTNGNVLLNCTARNGKLPSDFHMYFSAANLFDGTVCEGDSLEADYRPYGGGVPHGVTTTQSVFWNTRGARYPTERFFFEGKPSRRKQVAVDSHQWGNGYVIGTQGPAFAVESDNFVEGVGQGETLEPLSLYVDQLLRRLGK